MSVYSVDLIHGERFVRWGSASFFDLSILFLEGVYSSLERGWASRRGFVRLKAAL